VTNPHPDKFIILLKVLNFQLQLIVRKTRSDRKKERICTGNVISIIINLKGKLKAVTWMTMFQKCYL